MSDEVIRLNFGCGKNIRPGWVNIDPMYPGAQHRWNAGEKMPLPDNSVDYIFSEHMLEHLTYREAAVYFAESNRVLKLNGVLRTVLPDFRKAFVAYTSGDAQYFDAFRGWPLIEGQSPRDHVFIDYLNYAVYQYGEHKCLWDEEKLRHEMLRAGFKSANLSTFDADVDSHEPVRREFSLYMNAFK